MMEGVPFLSKLEGSGSSPWWWADWPARGGKAEDSSRFSLVGSCKVSRTPSYDGGSNICKKVHYPGSGCHVPIKIGGSAIGIAISRSLDITETTRCQLFLDSGKGKESSKATLFGRGKHGCFLLVFAAIVQKLEVKLK